MVRLGDATGSPATTVVPLSSGNNAVLYKAALANGRTMVVKQAAVGAGLDIEGYMLRLLAQRSDLPVPAVYLADDDLLVSSMRPACWRAFMASPVNATGWSGTP